MSPKLQKSRRAEYRGTEEIQQRRKQIKQNERENTRKSVLQIKKLQKSIADPTDSQPESQV